MERMCASPERAQRSRTSGSSAALGANTSAATSGARAPNNSSVRRASRSRTAPRPFPSPSSWRMRRATSTPRRASPTQRPATSHSVPPRAGWDAGQRMLSAPPHGPASTRASTSPPSAGAGSASRTTTARTIPPSPAASPAPPPPVHLGALLVARERQLREHLALVRRDVMRRQAVQRVHQHVAPAGVAPAEPGEPPAQLLVLALHHFGCDVPYPTTASSCTTGQAVNVEPVVPVSRTRR